MIYCELNSLCRPIENGFVFTNSETGDTVKPDLWGWEGHTITIDYFEELTELKTEETKRRYKFGVWPYKFRWNCHNDIFYLELTNESADHSTDFETFLKDARVTLLRTRGKM